MRELSIGRGDDADQGWQIWILNLQFDTRNANRMHVKLANWTRWFLKTETILVEFGLNVVDILQRRRNRLTIVLRAF